MAKLTKNGTSEAEVVSEKGTPRVTRCNLVNVATKPWLVAFVNAIYEGTLFLNSVAVREKQDGDVYITFPSKKRVNRDGSDYTDDNGKPVYDPYYGPADLETRKHLEEIICEAVQNKMDGKDTPKTEKGEEKVYVNLVEGREGLVAMCNVVAKGKFFMTGVAVNEKQDGDVYLKFPSRKRVNKDGSDVLDNGRAIYDPYFGPATKEDYEKVMEMVVDEVQAKISESEA